MSDADAVTLSAHCHSGRPAVLVAVGPADVLRAAATRGRPVTTTPGILPTHDVHLADVQTDTWDYVGRALIAYHVDHTRHAPGSPLARAHARVSARHQERDRLAAQARSLSDAPLPPPAVLRAYMTATADAITAHPDTPLAQTDPRAILATAPGQYGWTPDPEPGPVDPATLAHAYAVLAAPRADDDSRRAAADAITAADLAEHEARRAWTDAARALLPPDIGDEWEMEDVYAAEWRSPSVGDLAGAHDHAEYEQIRAREHARRLEMSPADGADHVRAVARTLDVPHDTTTHALAAVLRAVPDTLIERFVAPVS